MEGLQAVSLHVTSLKLHWVVMQREPVETAISFQLSRPVVVTSYTMHRQPLSMSPAWVVIQISMRSSALNYHSLIKRFISSSDTLLFIARWLAMKRPKLVPCIIKSHNMRHEDCGFVDDCLYQKLFTFVWRNCRYLKCHMGLVILKHSIYVCILLIAACVYFLIQMPFVRVCIRK